MQQRYGTERAELDPVTLPKIEKKKPRFFTRPLAQASRNSAFEMSPLPSLSTCVKLTMNGAAAALANKSPDGTALFQIASHCSGFRTAAGIRLCKHAGHS